MSLYLTESYVQQEAVHQEPVPSVTVPKYNCLSNKRQSTKNQQGVSPCTSTEVSVQQEAVVYQEPATCVTLYLNTGFRPTKGSSPKTSNMGAGIAQWLERRTRDWKVAGSNPCWNGGRIFFSRVDFLCWLLFRYPFHPRVTTVARKKSRSFCQKCRCQVTAKHAYTLRMWILLNRASALVTTCP